jgi:preprotein translocase subunit YajC
MSPRQQQKQSLEFVLSALSSGDGIVVPTGIIASIESIANLAAEEYKGFKKRQQELF